METINTANKLTNKPTEFILSAGFDCFFKPLFVVINPKHLLKKSTFDSFSNFFKSTKFHTPIYSTIAA
jgi:hypothetical protein